MSVAQQSASPPPEAPVSRDDSPTGQPHQDRDSVARLGRGAALIAILASAIVAGLLGYPPPLDPLAALIMEWTPVPIANALLDLLGDLGKPLAIWGGAALAIVLSGLIALLCLRGPFGRLNWVVATALVALLCVPLARAGGGAGLALLGVTYLLALAYLAARPPRAIASASRRRMLIDVGLNVGVVALASLIPLGAARARTALLGRRPRPPLFQFSAPAARAAGFDLPGLTSEITPLSAFYRMSKNVADPVVDETIWNLAIAGRVRRAVSLTLDDLVELPRTDLFATMQCVSNPVAGPLWSAALFTGVRLAELLARADPLSDARWISFEAPDGHREQLSIERALDPRIMVAYSMNGEWLDPAHGFPARLLATGLYGFRSVKWLTRIELLREPKAGHWEERGWTASEINTTARVDLVRRDPQGGIAAGVAFAGTRGVRAVEVRVDRGAWQPADLHAPPLSDSMWVQWRASLAVPASPARVEARAVDGHGLSQEETVRAQFPNGATGLHGLDVPA